jgi:hypothetical protein
MNHVLNGARAALLVGAVLTLWSFLRVSEAMQTASDATGFAFVAVAFGMLTTLTLLWALVVAAIGAVVEAVGPRFRTAIAILGTIAAILVVGGGVWLATIPGIDPTAVAMSLVVALGVPSLTALQQRIQFRSILWTYGVPVAGIAASLTCFVGASGWASSTAAMREAVTRNAALVAVESHFLRQLGDGDGDGFAGIYGGADCDDSAADVHPMAREIPGNGIDDDCSGGDASP